MLLIHGARRYKYYPINL